MSFDFVLPILVLRWKIASNGDCSLRFLMSIVILAAEHP